MESHSKLDLASVAGSRRLIFLLLVLCSLPAPGLSQTVPATRDRVSEIRKLYDVGRWSDVVAAVPESPDEVADLELYRGLALARLQRWEEAKKALQAGLVRNPRDTRFLVELAGIAYREKQFPTAKRELRRALAIERRDDYANIFLASIYFLEGNLEAELKYWNRAGKPILEDLVFDPQARLNPLVLDRAFAFSPRSEWRRDQFLTTRARLEALELFPGMEFELEAQANGSFDLIFHGSERNGWGSTKWEGLISLLRGLPYQSVYPEFYNLERKGLNWRSLVRWDDEKRRLSTEIAAPLGENPEMRFRIYFDGRNENWDLTNTIAPSTPSSARLNLERAAAGAEIRFIASGRWQWKEGVEYTYRRFRSVEGIPAQAAPFFTNASAIALRSGIQRSLVRFPERRFTLDSRAAGEFGAFFENPLGKYGRIEGSLTAKWFPKARGEDYEMQASLRGGRTLGKIPFDELLVLGFDRDNELWLRGHPGLRNGEKGNAPLGRNYVLMNWEMDKIVYKGAFLTLKAGPFLDTGRTYDPSGYFGSPNWLWDSGIQAKIRVLGSFEFVLGYGKDLRSGNNSFYTTVSRQQPER
jgi:tetratricopeptide (TPR) repeat protein